jgi:hypothetical protein
MPAKGDFAKNSTRLTLCFFRRANRSILGGHNHYGLFAAARNCGPCDLVRRNTLLKRALAA